MVYLDLEYLFRFGERSLEMGYGATISFKIAPDYYVVVKAMAAGHGPLSAATAPPPPGLPLVL
jgi:hypothetical protein